MMNILAILRENVPFLGMMNFRDPNSKVGIQSPPTMKDQVRSRIESFGCNMIPITSMGRLYIYLHISHKNQPFHVAKYTIVPRMVRVCST